ncbi:response regulator [Nocardiopsis dassonvillei]|uniref:response regulator n=1 Tax=Nocardiopsis dassonvillei TaxID=2014 RepID=UPI0008FC37BC|nr:response regulator [Nocardiopsis dassonvillei]APC35728.1 response regulator [Nocardiopsis dassonvillei]
MTYVMAAVVMMIMVALGVFFVVTVASVAGAARADLARPGRRRTPAAPAPQAVAVDAAEEELRLRYARGQIDREEFLQRKIDLER